MKRELLQRLFHYVIRFTPEKWEKIRACFVGSYIISAGSNLSIGRCCQIHKNVKIGSNSGVGYRCIIPNGVEIGQNVMMGPEVIMYTQNHATQRLDQPMRMQGMRELKPIVIEDDVWIGARACILPGVTIGHGAVIGACAVVSKDVPPYAVLVGNPGRIVKMRNIQE